MVRMDPLEGGGFSGEASALSFPFPFAMVLFLKRNRAWGFYNTEMSKGQKKCGRKCRWFEKDKNGIKKERKCHRRKIKHSVILQESTKKIQSGLRLAFGQLILRLTSGLRPTRTTSRFCSSPGCLAPRPRRHNSPTSTIDDRIFGYNNDDSMYGSKIWCSKYGCHC